MFFWGVGGLLGPAMMAHLQVVYVCMRVCVCVFVYVWVNFWFEEQG